MIPVLMIALEFAPVQTTGAFRSIAFARHLPEFGFRPIVVTIEAEQAAAIFQAPRNDALLAQLPEMVAIETLAPDRLTKPESQTRALLRIMTSLDDRFFQKFRAALDARLPQIASRYAPKLVYVSAPPFGATALGVRAAQALGLPCVLDMRDAWAEWGMAPFPTYLHYRTRRADETQAFSNASAIVTVTDRLRALFRASHPGLAPDKFHVIPNGFDGESIEGGPLMTTGAGDHFDVAYVGSYYYTPPKPRSLRRPHSLLHYLRGHEDWSYRSPLYFFRAWRALRDVDPAAAKRLRFHHIGKAPPWLAAMASEYGVEAQCTFHGQIPKQDVAALLDRMDAQLATSMKRPDGGDYCLASKTFDYIVARKPILAFVTEGSQKDFLAASGAALLFDPDDMNGSARGLRALLAQPPALTLDDAFLNRFHRRKNTARLAGIFEDLIAGRQVVSPEVFA